MSESKINSALVSAYIESAIMPPACTAFEGVDFAPPTGQGWARLTNMPTSRTKPGLCRQDSNEILGYLQIDLFWPRGIGTGPILTAADQLLDYFEPRQRLSYQGQNVQIRRVERSAIRIEDVWQVVSVFVYYRANVSTA